MGTWDECSTWRGPPEPRRDLVETCWRFRAPSGRAVTCAIYCDTAPGLDVRAGSATTICYGRSGPWTDGGARDWRHFGRDASKGPAVVCIPKRSGRR
jgi:hypothetical protein